MNHMFAGASSFDQDLGWCVDDNVNMELVQSNVEQHLLLQPRGLPSNCLRFLAHELVRGRTRRLRREHLRRRRYVLDGV